MSGRNPLSIFPEELWRQILGHLETPEDLKSAWFTCDLWQGLLYENTTSFFFPDVFVHLYKYLPLADILTARLVCKLWDNGVSAFLEKGQPAMFKDSSCIFETYGYFRQFVVDFDMTAERWMDTEPGQHAQNPYLEAMEKFSSAFDHTSTKNPFLSRSLMLEIQLGFNDNSESKSIDFLKCYGSHLSSLELCISDRGRRGHISVVQRAALLWQVLAYVPNLRKLNVSKVISGSQDIPKLQMLQLFVDNNPVPELKHLKVLTVCSQNSLTEPLLNAYGPQLHTLKALVTLIKTETAMLPFSPSPMMNLKHLILRVIEYQLKLEVLERIQRYLQGPSVETVELLFSSRKTDEQYLLPLCMLSSIKHLEGSLRSLCIHLELGADKFNSGVIQKLPHSIWPQLDLPNLQELTVSTTGPIQSFNVLSSKLKSLKKFKFYHWDMSYERTQKIEHPEDSEEVDLLWCDDLYFRMDYHDRLAERIAVENPTYPCRVYQSNVWRLIPTLEQITVIIRQIGQNSRHYRPIEIWDMRREFVSESKTRTYTRQAGFKFNDKFM